MPRNACIQYFPGCVFQLINVDFSGTYMKLSFFTVLRTHLLNNITFPEKSRGLRQSPSAPASARGREEFGSTKSHCWSR